MYEKKLGMKLFRQGSSFYKYSILMKLGLAIPLLLAANIHVSAFTFGQTFTLKKNKVKVEQLLNELQRQTGYNIFYDESMVPAEAHLDVSYQGASLQTVLTDIADKYQLSYRVVDKNVVLSRRKTSVSTATIVTEIEKPIQRRIITGVVADEKGQPLSGVTIREIGHENRSSTDEDGKFVLELQGTDGLLRFSLVGYLSKEQMVGASNNMNIRLEVAIQEVDEVVVIGYGTQKKENLTGAVSQVSGKDFEDRPLANLSQKLQGAIPNLNVSFSSGRPGSVGTFNIRGNTSINGGRPLILIDGVEGNIDRLNSNDVESVTVLKDASASAVYGARASFGVILITTKKGASGQSEVNYTARTSVSKSTTSTDFERRGYYSAKINDDFFRSYAGKNYTKYTEDDYYQLWIRRNDKTEHPDRPWVTTDNRDGQPTYVYYANTDLYNFLYDDSRPTWENNLSFSGGTDKIRYYLSGNIFDQQGIIKHSKDDFRSNNFRLNMSAQVTPWMEISSNTKYFSSRYNFPGYRTVNDLFDFSLYSGLASFVPVNPDGSAVYLTSLMDYRYAEGRVALLTNGYHRNADKWDDFSTMFETKFDITPNLDIRANYSHSRMRYNAMKRSDHLEYSKYPEQYDVRTDDIGLSRLEDSKSDYIYHATNLYGNYAGNFNQHNIAVVAGINYETQHIADVYASREGLLTKDLDDFNLAKGDVINLTGGKNAYAIMGVFSRVNYDYDGKYLFEASGRYDGTSRFKSGSRFGFFPSASAGWRISEEHFFDPLKGFIDDLKVRYSYGMLGNQQVAGYYDYLQLIDPSGQMNFSFGNGTKASSASVSAPNAGDLTWEKVTTNNIGLDMSFLQSRLSIVIDAYTRDTRDMLTTGKTLPSVYGAREPRENAADLRTKGWELAVSWHDQFQVAAKPFQYRIGIGLADYVSHITRFDNPTRLLSDYYVGQKLGDMWGYHIDGFFKSDEEAANYRVDQSAVNTIINSSAGSEKGLKAGDLKYMDLDGDDIISFGANTADNPGDRTIIGNSQPRYTIGTNLSASWNNIDVSAFFQGIGRQDWYPAPHAISFWGPYSRPFASFIPSNFMDDVWSPENPEAYFPRARGYTAMATNRQLGAVNNKYIQNLAYIRLKNLSVGYRFEEKLLSKIGFRAARVYFSGDNLLTWTKLRSDYIDPEQATGASNTSKVYPWAKTYAIGIELGL